MSPDNEPLNLRELSRVRKSLLLFLSFAFVALGQPAWSWLLGLGSAALGYALFWRLLLCYSDRWKRFWLSTFWFTGVQLFQLSWFASHPFHYIYGPYVLLSLGVGLQFGVIGLLIKPAHLVDVKKIFTIAGLWTLMEWSRMFFLSGFSWNPAGMALTGSLYSMQMASLWGVYGLSFWVILTNLLGLRAWLLNINLGPVLVWVVAVLVPYTYGAIQVKSHHEGIIEHDDTFAALLVQPSFPAEAMTFQERKNMVGYVTNQWKQILEHTKKYYGKKVDLIALPEYVVPFGTYTLVFPYEEVRSVFEEAFGEEALEKMASLEDHLAGEFYINQKRVQLVSNAYWFQSLSNLFNAPVVAGLEDVEEREGGGREYFSAAQYFKPSSLTKHESRLVTQSPMPERYDKQVLVPMGEYIPFSFCRELCAAYGVQGSFTHGKGAKVFQHPKAPFGVSICYEETFGNIIRQNRVLGATLLLNLTSDAWFPGSRLPQQHFDHARVRSVENGTPILRACNTGITGCVDSLGRTVAVLGENHPDPESISDAILVEVPTYHYFTLYSVLGDSLIVAISILGVIAGFRFRDFEE